MNLADSTVVVTGATTGIGRAIAFTVGRAGARVAICARTAPDVSATVAALQDAGIDAVGTRCDVSEPSEVAAFAEFVRRTRGPARVVVNNAGIGRFAPLEQLTLGDWDTTIAVNLRSLYLVTRAFLDDLLATAPGAVLNIASLAARNGVAGGTAYCASKHAVLGFSRALMLELRHRGIRVIAICPGSVATPFVGKQDRPGRTPRERMLQAEQVAEAAVATLTLGDNALVSELDIRPTSP